MRAAYQVQNWGFILAFFRFFLCCFIGWNTFFSLGSGGYSPEQAQKNKYQHIEALGNEVLSWFGATINHSEDDKLTFKNEIVKIEPVEVIDKASLRTLLDYLASQVDPEISNTMVQKIKTLMQGAKIRNFGWEIWEDEGQREWIWAYSKVFLGQVYDQLFRTLGVYNPQYEHAVVIHFRCSDTPFIKHGSYTLMPYSYFHKVVEEMHDFRDQHWHLITDCGHHVPEEKKHLWCDACTCYAEDMITYFSQFGITIEHSTARLPIEDQAAIYYASAKVLASPSSFSFLPAMVSQGLTVAPTEGYEPKQAIPGVKIFNVKTTLNHNETNWENCSETLTQLHAN